MRHLAPSSALRKDAFGFQIGEGRFFPPLSISDQFTVLNAVSGDVDFLGLKGQAEDAAKRQVHAVTKHHVSAEEQIWGFLAKTRYRRGPLELMNTAREVVMPKLRASIHERSKIIVTISFFPCKVRQPLKTFAREGSEVDIGELGTLLRLYELSFGLSCLHPPGAQFVVTCDGMRYQRCFGDPVTAIETYQRNIHKMIRFLGIDDFVTLIDESSLYDKTILSNIEEQNVTIAQQYLFRKDPEIVAIVDQILPNIIMNLDIDGHRCDLAGMLRIYCRLFGGDAAGGRHGDGKTEEQSSILLQRGLFGAFRFAAINRVVYEARVHERYIPSAIKTTVHPKRGQIGVHALNRSSTIFAHCGQGIVKAGSIDNWKIDDIRTNFAANILRRNRGKAVIGVLLDQRKYDFAHATHPFMCMDLLQ